MRASFRSGWGAMAPYRLNPKRFIYLSEISNAVLTPHLIDESFWDDRSRAYRDYDGKHVDFERLGPLWPKHQREREAWCKAHLEKYQWEAGAVFDCLISSESDTFIYHGKETLEQIKRAKKEYFRNTPKRRKISSTGIVD